MTKRSATIAGFLIASAIPPLILAFNALLAAPEGDFQQISEALLLFGTAFLVFLPYSVIFVALIGVPAFLICNHLGMIKLWAALSVGIFGGVIVSLVVSPAGRTFFESIFWFIPVAVIAAIAFWAVWSRGSSP